MSPAEQTMRLNKCVTKSCGVCRNELLVPLLPPFLFRGDGLLLRLVMPVLLRGKGLRLRFFLVPAVFAPVLCGAASRLGVGWARIMLAATER